MTNLHLYFKKLQSIEFNKFPFYNKIYPTWYNKQTF